MESLKNILPDILFATGPDALDDTARGAIDMLNKVSIPA
jgi:hypothetical protein